MQRLKRTITLGFIISLLLASTLFFSMTSAQDNGALEGKTETILGILKEVNGSLVMTFNELIEEGIEIPFMAKKNYREGNSIAGEALSLADEGNYLQASSRAVEALQVFKEALIIADEALPNILTTSEETAQEAITLKATITRTTEYVKRLENIYNQTIAQGYNSVTLRSSIEAIKRHLESALNKIETGDFKGARLEITSAKNLLTDAMVPLLNLTNEVKASKTEQFIIVAEKRLTTLRANITAVSLQVSPQVRNASLTALNRAESSLQNARELMDSNNIAETINELVKSEENMKDSVTILELAGVKVDTEKNELNP